METLKERFDKNLVVRIARLKDEKRCRESLLKFYDNLYKKTVDEIKEIEIELNYLEFSLNNRDI